MLHHNMYNKRVNPLFQTSLVAASLNVAIEGSCETSWEGRSTSFFACAVSVRVRKVQLFIDDDDIDMQRFPVVMSQGTAASTRLGSTCTMGMKSVNWTRITKNNNVRQMCCIDLNTHYARTWKVASAPLLQLQFVPCVSLKKKTIRSLLKA